MNDYQTDDLRNGVNCKRIECWNWFKAQTTRNRIFEELNQSITKTIRTMRAGTKVIRWKIHCLNERILRVKGWKRLTFIGYCTVKEWS